MQATNFLQYDYKRKNSFNGLVQQAVIAVKFQEAAIQVQQLEVLRKSTVRHK